MAENMDVETLWLIRDCRGLNTAEKSLLFVFATRGNAFASAKTNAEDMGASRSTYYDTRKSLIERGLVTESLRTGSTTIYLVNKEGVRNLAGGCPESTMGGVLDSVGGCPESNSQRKPLRKPIKEKEKGTPESPSVADAPSGSKLDSLRLGDEHDLVSSSRQFTGASSKGDKSAPLLDSGHPQTSAQDDPLLQHAGEDTEPPEVLVTNAEAEGVPEPPEEMSESQISLATADTDEPVVGTPRERLEDRVGKLRAHEIEGLLEKVDEAHREPYAQRLYEYALENNEFTQIALSAVLIGWQESDGVEVSTSLALSMW